MEKKTKVTRYETLFVVHPDKGGRIKEFVDKFRRVIEGLDGTVDHVDEWGLKDLAYRIQKQAKGYYTLLQYRSSSRVVEEVERNMRLTDGVLRYLTVRAEEERPTTTPSTAKGHFEEGRNESGEAVAKSEPHS